LPAISFPATTGLRFDWKYPEPAQVNYQLGALEGYLQNTEVLAASLKEHLIADMEDRFESETDPDGHPWEALEEPAPTQIGILRLTEDLRNAAVSEDAWTATPEGVFFDTSVLPDYWVFHEQPEGQGSQRIPRRAFVGASPEAEVEAVMLAETWLEVGLAKVAPRVGRVGSRFERLMPGTEGDARPRGISGRFARVG